VNRIPTNKKTWGLISSSNEVSPSACRGGSHRTICNAKEHNGMEGSAVTCARRDALARERSIVVNGYT
jgi:hypothetical protein